MSLSWANRGKCPQETDILKGTSTQQRWRKAKAALTATAQPLLTCACLPHSKYKVIPDLN